MESLANGQTLLCQFNFDRGFQLDDFYDRAPAPVTVRFQFSLSYTESTKQFNTRLWGNIAGNTYEERVNFPTLANIRMSTQEIEGVKLEISGSNSGNTPGKLKIQSRGSYNSNKQSAKPYCSI